MSDLGTGPQHVQCLVPVSVDHYDDYEAVKTEGIKALHRTALRESRVLQGPVAVRLLDEVESKVAVPGHEMPADIRFVKFTSNTVMAAA